MRAFAERALDLYAEYLDRLDDLPIARHTPVADVRRALLRPLPEDGLSDEEVVARMREVLIDWGVQCGHPRFMAYITGSGTVPGAVAEMLAAGVNMNVGGWQLSPGPTEIEHDLMRWFGPASGCLRRAEGCSSQAERWPT